MKSLNHNVFFCLLLSVFVFVPGSAYAQTSRGTVTGTVTDPSGAVIEGAEVMLVNQSTNAARETQSNASGLYRFDAVDLGSYSLKVSKSGFRTSSLAGIDVQANRTLNLDVRLEIGTTAETVQVESSVEQLQTTEAVRGGNFQERSVSQLPLQGLDPINVLLLLPGAQNARTTQFSNGSNNYSVNGQRARSNNFMIDGVENNDISVAGPAYQITNPDAVQEVSAQTSQFSAEFGRAGGAVVNEITKSGTNQIHGTASWIYLSHVFNATDNSERLGAAPGEKIPAPFVENIPSFTFGGPVYFGKLYDGRNKTFFFAAAQWDRFFASALGGNLRVPTDAGVAVLQSLASACPNVALYLQAIGSLRGNPGSSPSNISIAVPSATESCTDTTRTGQTVETGLVSRSASQNSLDNNHLIRIDHNPSTRQSMSFRWLYDQGNSGPFFNNMDGFDRGFTGRTMSALFTDTYMIRPSWTNEFRFNYGRIGFNFPSLAPDDFHANLPNYAIAGLTGFGVATNIPQFRFANNWQYQDTMTVLSGRHTFRFGLDFLRQLARQHPPFNERGAFSYQASTGASTATGLANFIDDFGGRSGTISRQFGDSVYHPNLFRQAYFFEDTWRTTTSFTLTLGLRYENYGQPANTFAIPAFTSYSTTDFATPNKVKRDDNNFGPLVAFAWNPRFSSGFLGKLFGNGKSVWRGGYQISYDAFFNNLLSNIAGSSPNTLGGQITSPTTGRGSANFSSLFGTIQPTPPTALSPQTSLFDPNIRNPYTQRWSLGLQRELPSGTLLDMSYVGTVGHKLFQTLDMNPFVSPGVRFVSTVGQRTMRASSGNSAYHAFQLSVRRRYGSSPLGSFQLGGSYTWSHYLDTISEVFGTDATASAFESAPQVLGFSPNLDRGSSDNDRRHRLVLDSVWDVRGPKSGVLGQILGYWTLATIWQLETGAPFTVRNGFDRNGDGQSFPDRPDIGNPNAPVNTRANNVASTVCPTLLQNIDTGSCVTANNVRWIVGTGAPGANTAGRNLITTPAYFRTDLDVIKRFPIHENVKLEYRAEIFNLFNRQNFGVPGLSVGTTPAGEFLDFNLTEATGRSMRMGLKIIF